jgi:hypothetical protein
MVLLGENLKLKDLRGRPVNRTGLSVRSRKKMVVVRSRKRLDQDQKLDSLRPGEVPEPALTLIIQVRMAVC